MALIASIFTKVVLPAMFEPVTSAEEPPSRMELRTPPGSSGWLPSMISSAGVVASSGWQCRGCIASAEAMRDGGVDAGHQFERGAQPPA